MPADAPAPTLRELLHSLQRDAVVTLPVLVAMNEGAEAAVADLSGTARTLVAPPTNWAAEDILRLADSLVLVAHRVASHGATELRLTLGRSRRSDYRLADDSVSAVHAHIGLDLDTLEYVLEDAGSRNGTFVNARRLAQGEKARLWTGAVLGFGKSVFCFLEPASLRKLASLLKSSPGA